MQPLGAAEKPCPGLERNVEDARFRPGQVWTYSTRAGEQSSTLTILEVDRSLKLGVLVHIRVDGVALHEPNGNVLSTLEHMPFTRDAMLTSVVHLAGQAKKMPTMEGYEEWARNCGGVYSISVAEAIDVNQRTLNGR